MVLQPTGFDAFSDVFSHNGIYELSRSATPSNAVFDPDKRPLEPHVQILSLNDGLYGAFPRTQDIGRGHEEPTADHTSSTAANLPTELLQAVYGHLSPLDFNAARHTCIAWMTASLNVDILAEQLQRGGWWSGASSKVVRFQESRQAWPVSCYFARECALAGNRTGQELSSQSQAPSSPMIEASMSDFGPLLESTPSATDHQQSCSPQVCATSTCGRYITVTSGSEMFTYEIEGQSLCLLSRTSCERQVLSVTIDANPERFVIAAILEGRIGLYIDMLGKSEHGHFTASSPWESAGTLNNASTASAPVMDLGIGDGAGASDVPVGDIDELSLNAGSIGESSFLHQSVEIVTQRSWAEYFHSPRAHLRGIRQLPASRNGVWPSTLNFTDKGKGKKSAAKSLPQLVYRNVCTENDPPISIAISPTRQCVAFGCEAGVELYWVGMNNARQDEFWQLTLLL